MCAEHATVRGLLENLPEGERKVTVLDMGASPEPFSRGTLASVDVMLLVAEPYYKSLEAVSRLDDLAKQLGLRKVVVVANKVRLDEHREAIEEYCERNGLDLLTTLPFDETIASADLRGRSPLDMNGDLSASPGLAALDDLIGKIEDLAG